MSLLLPLFIYACRVIGHDILLADLLTRLILPLLNNLALSVDLLQHISLLDFVPLHYGLALSVHMFIIRDQIQSDVVKECLLVIVPQGGLIDFRTLTLIILSISLAGHGTRGANEILLVSEGVKLLPLLACSCFRWCTHSFVHHELFLKIADVFVRQGFLELLLASFR